MKNEIITISDPVDNGTDFRSVCLFVFLFNNVDVDEILTKKN